VPRPRPRPGRRRVFQFHDRGLLVGVEHDAQGLARCRPGRQPRAPRARLPVSSRRESECAAPPG
jgi:hypothetical protein